MALPRARRSTIARPGRHRMPTTRRRLLRAVTYWYEAHNDLPGHWTTYMWLRLSGEPGSRLIAPDDETLVSLWQAALQFEVEGEDPRRYF